MGFYATQMIKAAAVTLELTAVSTVLSLALGALGAVGRIHGPVPVRRIISGYVELVRGLPPILQLFVLYFGLNQFSIDLTPLTAAFIWMTLYGTGYAVEIFRAGFAGVHYGQHEASAALGLGPVLTFRLVTLPQAVAQVIPPLTNFLVLQLKNTTLVYIIGVPDIMFQARLGAGNTAQPLTIYAIAAVLYIVMNGAIARGSEFLYRRMEWTR